MTPAGQRDRRVVFERRTPVRDAYGGIAPEQGWSELAKRWGKLTPQSGVEQPIGDQVANREVVVVRVPYLEGLTTADRAQYDGETWDIIAIAEVGRREELDVTMRTHDPETGPR